MTNREKLIQVLRDNIEYELRHYPDDNYVEVAFNYEAIADALIKANIGDVSAVKAEQEEIKLFHAEIKNGEIEMTVGSAGFKTFFALVEQIFKQNGATAFLTTTIEGGNDIKYAVTIQRVGEKSPAEELRQATELWKHEKHRAEVAERACDILRKIKDDEIKRICKERDDFARREEIAELVCDAMIENMFAADGGCDEICPMWDNECIRLKGAFYCGEVGIADRKIHCFKRWYKCACDEALKKRPNNFKAKIERGRKDNEETK